MTHGCHNRQDLKTSAIVQDGWWMDGTTRYPRMVSVPVPMTKDCQYTRLNPADPACTGCRHHNTK